MINTTTTNTTSTASSPDLDWSQVRETLHMLHLAVAQIDMAMKDGDESIDTLSNSFTSMIGSVNVIAAMIGDLDGSGSTEEIKSAIERNCKDVSGRMHSSIMAFQFYDRLSQRLSNVTHSLESLSELVGDQSQLYSPYAWKGMQEKIRSNYSMQEEQDMFDALLSGMNVKDALKHLSSVEKETAGEDDVELF